jgi:hypothetical protein
MNGGIEVSKNCGGSHVLRVKKMNKQAANYCRLGADFTQVDLLQRP